ncbi:MAG TPA: hypothetical protein VJ696_12315 [Rhodanobacteraceae bacterium]|nr:hypothetical protein [Rhodanobacteraceae bacterium]
MPLLRPLVGLVFVFALAAIAAEPAPTPDYAWPNLTDFLKRLVERVGPPIKVYRLTMDRDGKVDLWIQDQNRRDLVDSYEYDHGAITDPIPVKFEHYPSIEALDHHVIELTDIDFQRLPSMLATVRAKLKLPDARVSSIELERGDSHGMLTYSDIPIWTFHVETPRHDGRVELSLDGKVLDADKD